MNSSNRRPLLRRWPLLGLVAFTTVFPAVLALTLSGDDPARAQDAGSKPPGQPAGLQIATERGSLDVSLEWDDVGRP